jgi:WD40 repeat protein
MNASVNSGALSAAASAHSGEARKKSIRRRCHLHTTIDAHEHPVNRMLIGSSPTSSFVATASSKGTTIRVFGLPHGQQLYEWHRGSRSCQILSLSWNGLGDRLVSYGSSNTIHVFEWNQQQQTKKPVISEYRHGEARNFEEIQEDDNRAESTNAGSTQATSEKPLYKRIGAAIRHHTVGSSTPTAPLKHRSFAKLKCQSTLPKDQHQLVVAMLDRCDANVISGDKNSESSREDTVVVCSSDGELRQYSVKLDGSTKLVQLEDVLVAGAKAISNRS